jgi:hypothetical protein
MKALQISKSPGLFKSPKPRYGELPTSQLLFHTMDDTGVGRGVRQFHRNKETVPIERISEVSEKHSFKALSKSFNSIQGPA